MEKVSQIQSEKASRIKLGSNEKILTTMTGFWHGGKAYGIFGVGGGSNGVDGFHLTGIYNGDPSGAL